MIHWHCFHFIDYIPAIKRHGKYADDEYYWRKSEHCCKCGKTQTVNLGYLEADPPRHLNLDAKTEYYKVNKHD